MFVSFKIEKTRTGVEFANSTGPSHEMPSDFAMCSLAMATMAGTAILCLSMRPAHSARQWVRMKSWDTVLDLRDGIAAMVAHPRKSNG